MTDGILTHEPALRIICFVSVLAIMMVWEFLTPRRRAVARLQRWANNLGLVLLNSVLLRVFMPAAAVGAALFAAREGWGLMHWLDLPGWLAVVLTIVLLDLAIWAQHVAMHKIPLLWRLHRVHHSDVDYDTTTGLRFHPIEIGLSMAYKMACVVALGAPAAAVILFEIFLSASALFNHGNVFLPAGLDRVLRRAIVTPDMHRVHHSVYRDETDSNYGFSLSIWDILFGTYRAQPRDGHEGMTIGLDVFRAPRDRVIDRLLIQPFRAP